MRGKEFLNKMELVNPAYVEAADTAPKAKRKVWTGWRAAVAACICLVLLAGTAAAVSGHGATWLVEMFSGREAGETGYELGVDIRGIPVSELSEKLRAVSEEIVHQSEVYQPTDSRTPGSWVERNFSADEAWDFIGLTSLQKPDWDLQEWFNTLCVFGDSGTGKIELIVIYTGYQVGDIRLQATSEIITENFEGEMRLRSVISGDGQFTETFRPTPGGNNCQIISSGTNELGYLEMAGYLVENGILYELSVTYQEQDTAQAEELLYQWADMF